MMLDDICKAYGVRLLSYETGKDVLRRAHLEDAAARTAGLAFYLRGTPVILFDETRPPMELLFVIAHELGHIMLGHLTFRRDFDERLPDSAEREADSFAIQLVANEMLRVYGGVTA